jgi:hypothetical protein
MGIWADFSHDFTVKNGEIKAYDDLFFSRSVAGVLPKVIAVPQWVKLGMAQKWSVKAPLNGSSR